MNEFEQRIRRLFSTFSTRFAEWWSHSKTRVRQFPESDAGKRAAAAMHDLKESEASKRAAAAVHDLRESEAGKRAASAVHDLRESDVGKRAEQALTDLRQSEPVKKAEESARRVLHDLRTGGNGSTRAS
jgi:hypothetical protein